MKIFKYCNCHHSLTSLREGQFTPAQFQGFLSNLLTCETAKCHLYIVLSEELYHLYILAHSIENATLI